MRDERLDRLADVLVRYSSEVKKGELVMIQADPISMPLVEALYEKCLEVGAHPFWRARSDALAEILLEKGLEGQLEYTNPIDLYAIETVDVRYGIWAETNTRAASQTDPSRQAAVSRGSRPVLEKLLERFAAGTLRWCGTQYPTPASAQDAEMSLRDYERFVFGAGLLDEPDPVAAWRAVHDRQERVREMLQTKKELRFQAPPRDGHDGTDLVVGVDGGTWINCAGKENFPDGEVFCGPQDVNGRVNYTFPAAHDGREVEGVRLTFKGGRVVDASATKNESFLIAMLEQDEGARNLGEIAIGTNYGVKRYTRNTLFDEKIGGSFHAAVGAGYPESGSNNQSALHWDMVCDLRPDPEAGVAGGSIEADGEVIHRDGVFLLDGWREAMG